jgi:DnaJ-class molecular chaperone
MNNKDYYHVLGVNHDASTEEIKRAYRKLAMQCHPDHNQGNTEWANKRFKEINEAFNILGDPEKRSQYDVFGSVENIGDIFSSQSTAKTLEDLVNNFGDGDPEEDFLDEAFGYDFKKRRYRFRILNERFDSSRKSKFEIDRGIDLEDLFT